MKADPRQTHVALEFKHPTSFITCRFDPKGRFVFGSAHDRSVIRWELPTGAKTTLAAHDSWVGDLAFSRDGETLVTAGYDDTLMWWPVAAEAPQPARKVTAHEGWIRALAVSPDGELLASAGNDRVVKLWRMADGSFVRALEGHESHVYSLLFHPSGQSLLSGELKGTIHQWDAATGKRERSFDAKKLYTNTYAVDLGGAWSLALSPDGKHLTASGLHKTTNPLGWEHEPLILKFDWESAKLLSTHGLAKNERGLFPRARFHPDGFLIGGSNAAGFGAGAHLFFWNAEELPFHSFKMRETFFEFDLHPDGLQVAIAHQAMDPRAGSKEGMIRIVRMSAKL